MSYSPAAILFDDTLTDFLLRGAGLTGIVDGPEGSISIWFRVDGNEGVNRVLLRDDQGFLGLQLVTTNGLRVTGVNGGVLLRIETSAAFTSGPYQHALLSWRLGATPVANLYIDDVSDIVTTTLLTGSIDYTRPNWAIGSISAGVQAFEGAISDLYFITEYIDFAVEANRRKFIDANGRAVFLGDSGELPTGTAPSVYMRGNEADQGLNSGTGGDFVSQATQTPGETPGPFGPGSLPGGVASMLQLSRRAGRFHRFFTG